MKTDCKLFNEQNFIISALAVVLALFAAGCNKPKSEKVKTFAAATNARPAAQAPVLSTEDSEMFTPFMQSTNLSAGDKAWAELIRSLNSLPSPPQEWAVAEPTKDEVARFQKECSILVGQAADKARDFYTRFPKHDKADDAHKQEMALLQAAVQLGATNLAARLQYLEEAQLKNPNLTEDQRLELRMVQLQRRVSAGQGESNLAALAELEKGALALQKEFPGRSEVAGLLFTAAQAWFSQGNNEKSRALAMQITNSTAADDIKEEAQGLLRKLDRVGKPVDIKYTALDGRKVDVQQFKGKVVLIDFWATWCGPCLAELPKVKEAYNKFHAQGFEIVGISFDDDKAALEKLVTDEKMAWPQYFDAEDAGKKWGDTFDVVGIPAMWLLDKKGLLRDLNGHIDLATKVEKLLAEK